MMQIYLSWRFYFFDVQDSLNKNHSYNKPKVLPQANITRIIADFLLCFLNFVKIDGQNFGNSQIALYLTVYASGKFCAN